MSSFSLLVVLLINLRAVVSFSDRRAGESMVSSVATDWASNWMHSSSNLGLCGVRTSAACDVTVAMGKLL